MWPQCGQVDWCYWTIVRRENDTLQAIPCTINPWNPSVFARHTGEKEIKVRDSSSLEKVYLTNIHKNKVVRIKRKLI